VETTFVWSCSDATACSIDSSSGLFTAGTTPGSYSDVIMATSDTIYGTASVSVLATINIAAIPGVTAPVVGGTPLTNITPTAQYTGVISWTPTDNPFKGAQIYTATISLTPAAGYTLTGVSANFFPVRGATSVTNLANSGTITAVFPTTTSGPVVTRISPTSGPKTGGTPITITGTGFTSVATLTEVVPKKWTGC
jgi:hypothetical protein